MTTFKAASIQIIHKFDVYWSLFAGNAIVTVSECRTLTHLVTVTSRSIIVYTTIVYLFKHDNGESKILLQPTRRQKSVRLNKKSVRLNKKVILHASSFGILQDTYSWKRNRYSFFEKKEELIQATEKEICNKVDFFYY